MSSNVVDVIKGIVGELKEIARSETIVGQPITVGSKTIVPVVRITVGFGAGGGEGSLEDKKGSGFGGGGGGGARIEPAAFIVIDEHGISLLPAKPGSLDQILQAIPALASRLSDFKKAADSSKSSDK